MQARIYDIVSHIRYSLIVFECLRDQGGNSRSKLYHKIILII